MTDVVSVATCCDGLVTEVPPRGAHCSAGCACVWPPSRAPRAGVKSCRWRLLSQLRPRSATLPDEGDDAATCYKHTLHGWKL